MRNNKKSYKRGSRHNYNKKNKKADKKKSKIGNEITDRKKRNYKFIQRGKESEEAQRRQKTVEDKYRRQVVTVKEEHSQSDDGEELENPFEQLLNTLKTNKDKLKAIESSSSGEDFDEQDDDLDDEIESLQNQDHHFDSTENISEDGKEAGEDEEIFSEDESVESQEDNLSNDYSSESDVEQETDDRVKSKKNKIKTIDNVETENENIIEDAELDEEIENSNSSIDLDPFKIHFESLLGDSLLESVNTIPPLMRKENLKWKELGNLNFEIITMKDNHENGKQVKRLKTSLLIDNEIYAKEGAIPTILQQKDLDLEKNFIKVQLLPNISGANKKNLTENDKDYPLTSLQCELFSIINNYQDIFYPQRVFSNSEQIRYVYCLHTLNHMLKTRAKILHHNAKLAANSKNSASIVPDAYRDQGLVRPKVLIVLPFRDSAYKVVNLLISLLFGAEKGELAKTKGSVINYKRFAEEYTGETIHFPKHNPKPEDYEKTFAGNTDDTFRMGISLTKKCIKLYTDFYSSDILIASPLGLRMIVGAPGESERDYDFLSSIELLVLDQAEMFLAQNWDHLLHVLDHFHLQPQSSRNTDFSRVRPWCLNGWSKFYRQTLLFSSHDLPEFRSLFNNKCCNYAGKVRVSNPIVGGSIRHVTVQIPQVFHKIDVTSIQSSFDTRFKYFINEILPQYKSPSMAHCMIYVPSYFDYVRLRNYFKVENLNFVQICEYTKDPKIARARDMFYHSGAHFLLYSERAHFFRRTRIKGIRHLIMFQPPFWPNLYSEMINLMHESNQNPRDGLESSMSVTILYTKYDMMQVSGIIGTDRAGKLLQSGNTTHMFMTGE